MRTLESDIKFCMFFFTLLKKKAVMMSDCTIKLPFCLGLHITVNTFNNLSDAWIWNQDREQIVPQCDDLCLLCSI